MESDREVVAAYDCRVVRVPARLKALSPWPLLTAVAFFAAALGVGDSVFNAVKWVCLVVFVLAAVAWIIDRFGTRRRA